MNLKKTLPFLYIIFVSVAACKKSNSPSGASPSDADVYAAGYTTSSNGNTVATYWKNGVATALAPDGTSSIANAIAVEGDSVYIVGHVLSGNSSTAAVIWKNGVEGGLSDGLDASAIAVKADELYVAGNSFGSVDNFSTAAYWDNGTKETSFYYSLNSYADAIALSGNDVYIAGGSETDNSGYHPTY